MRFREQAGATVLQDCVGCCEEFAFLWWRLEEVDLPVARNGSGSLSFSVAGESGPRVVRRL